MFGVFNVFGELQVNESEQKREMSEIKEFFANRTILLTGVTGMMGKLILAKLMRLGNVKEVVLIVREKKNQTAVERIDSMMKEFLFEESDKYDSEFRKKLKVLNGDVQLLDLGLSNDDQAYIKSHVEIVLHGAATIKFTESLKRAVETNLRGTKALLDLAKDMKHLVSFIHVSTAFSQCYREDLKECFYTTPVTGEFVMSLCEKFDENLICALTPQIIYPWPNTYAFSKALVEDYIRRHKDDLPIAIIRPSISEFSETVNHNGNCMSFLFLSFQFKRLSRILSLVTSIIYSVSIVFLSASLQEFFVL